MNKIFIFGIVACVGCAAATELRAQVVSFSPSSQDAAAVLDYANAKAPLGREAKIAPTLQADPAALKQLHSSPGVSIGSDAKGEFAGKLNPVRVLPPRNLTEVASPSVSGGASPQQYGAAGLPYTTVRTNANGDVTSNYYPFRAAGRLFYNKPDGSSWLCSAALIKPAVIVTAAHCVANYGSNQRYTNWRFLPAYNNGVGPYGTYTWRQMWVLNSYLNGTDNCSQYGIVCPDDIAVIVLNKDSNGVLPGSRVGWFNYGWNGWGFTGGKTLITQLGYPLDLDGGLIQERTDLQGAVSTSDFNNTLIGSLQTGGASGGPWVNNLGVAPALGSGLANGTASVNNVIVGVDSWGRTDLTQKLAGASPFTSNNIAVLVNAACNNNVGYC